MGSGEGEPADPDRARKRTLIEAFLRASREGDMEGLMAVLDPEVEFRPDAAAAAMGARPLKGAAAVARMYDGLAQTARVALVDGEIGVVVAPRGRLLMVLRVWVAGGHIAAIESVADAAAVASFDLTLMK